MLVIFHHSLRKVTLYLSHTNSISISNKAHTRVSNHLHFLRVDGQVMLVLSKISADNIYKLGIVIRLDISISRCSREITSLFPLTVKMDVMCRIFGYKTKFCFKTVIFSPNVAHHGIIIYLTLFWVANTGFLIRCVTDIHVKHVLIQILKQGHVGFLFLK